MFERLIHADWSANPEKRWMAAACRHGDGWWVELVRRVPSASRFLDEWVFGGRSVLAGFDFPIGLPERYGNKTGFKNFLDALPRLGHGEWGSFFLVATC